MPPRSVHPSQCHLLCPCVAYADVYVTILDTSSISIQFVFSPSRRFGRLRSAIVQHVRRTRVVNAILFCSFTGSQSRRVCSRLRLLLFHLHLLSSWLLAVSHRSCAILFSFLFFSSSVQLFTFSSSSSGFALLVARCSLLVARSQFDTMALLSLSIYMFFSPFSVRPLAPPLSLLPCLPSST